MASGHLSTPRVPPLASVVESWLLVAIAYLALAAGILWALVLAGQAG